MILLVVSGGQTGADQAALRAAKASGIKTGGYVPKGWRTETGGAPWLGTMFGCVEHESEDYPPRTEMNVIIADGTVIFGSRSAGTTLTEELCIEHGKPKLWLKEYQQVNAVSMFRLWVCRNHIHTLNVAGNRESKARGIGLAVERFLREALPLCCKAPAKN